MTKECIFCKIVASKAPAAVIYEDEICLSFLDINQATKGKTLLIPKTHYADIREILDEILMHMAALLQKIILHFENIGLAQDFQVLSPAGIIAQQSVFTSTFTLFPAQRMTYADIWLLRNPMDSVELQDLAKKIRLGSA